MLILATSALLRTGLIVISIACVEVVRTVESCFGDAVPLALRRNIAVNGLPIGLYNQDWDSAQLLTHVLSLVISEVLGYSVVISGLGPASRPSIVDFVGCSEEGHGIICPPGPYRTDHPHHALVETWEQGWIFGYNEVLRANPELIVEMIPVGYDGNEGPYVPAAPLLRAQQDRGMHMEYYSELGAQWRSPWDYFDSYKSINVSRLLPCAQTQNAQALIMAPVIQWTPDPVGFDAKGKASCPDGFWWLAPECRHNTTRCVPYLTGGNGWYMVQVLQRAIAYHLPLAVAVAADWNNFKSIPLEFDVLAYSWEPSMHFISASFTRIVFPRTDTAAQKLGDFRTATSSEILMNLLRGGLDVLAPTVYAFLKEVRLTSKDIRSLMQLMDSTGDYSVAACSWLLNTTSWKQWLPDVKQCSRGAGLVSPQRKGSDFTENFTAAASCTPCSSGRFSEKLSGTIARVCTLCSPGQAQPMWGMDTCNDCLQGHYQDMVGQSLCERCRRGRYSNSTGRTQCTDCPDGKTTDGAGLTSVSDCGCPPSTYLDSSGYACIFCGHGMICEGFNTPTLAAFGYQLSRCGPDPCVFKCHSDPFRCPGGGLHQCTSGRTGVACAECEPGKRQASDSTCVDCESADSGLMLLLLVAICSFNATLYYKNISARSSLSVTFDIFCAILTQLLIVLQTLSAVATMNIGWLMQSKQVLAAFMVFAFDIDWAHATCIHLSVESRYVLRCMVTPLCIAVLVLIHICLVIFRCCKAVVSNRPHPIGLPAHYKSFLPLQASVCDFVMSFLFSIVSTFLSPFRCFLHPNQVWTMVEYESQICWQSREHTKLIIVASSLVLVVLVFVAYILWTMYRLEARLSSGDVDFLRANHFLFARIRPQRLWFAFVVVLRNFGVAILLVLPNAIWQTFTVELIIVFYSLIVFRAEPWRFSFLNVLDSFFGMDLLLIFACMFIKLSADVRIDILAVSAIACLGFAVVVAFVSAFFRHCRKSIIRFYLCYHRLSAGALARLLHLYLCHSTPQGGGKIFLRADCPSRLDIQLWWIENDTRTFLVVLTSQLFHNPWCLGEITTAVNRNVPMRLLYVPSFVPLAMSCFDSFIESDYGSILTACGIRMSDVKLAVLHLMDLLTSGTEHPLSLKSLETSLDQISFERRRRKSSTRAHVQNDELLCLLLHDTMVEESLMSAILLKQFLGDCFLDERRSVQMMLLNLKVELPSEVFPRAKIVLLSFLTHGCFHSNEFIFGLIFSSVLPGVVVTLPIVISDDFQYLTEENNQILLDDVESFCVNAALPETLLPDMLSSFRIFTNSTFNTIASLFSVESDLATLRLQTNAIWRRVEKGLRDEIVMGNTDVKQRLYDWMCTEVRKQLQLQYAFSEGSRMNLDSLDAFSSKSEGEGLGYRTSL